MSNETTPERPGDALVPVTVSPTLDLNEVPADALNGLQKMTPKKVPLPSAKPNSMFAEASAEPTGQIEIGNTTSFLLDTEKASIELGRKTRLRPYNDYREMCGFGRARTFADITRDPARQKALQALYHTPDDVEYYVGINAEDCRENSPLPPVLARLVAADAFSQALTNPLLAELIYKESTFTREGLREIDRTSCLSDLVNRNSDKTTYSVSMTRRDAS